MSHFFASGVQSIGASASASVLIKNLPAMQETWVRFLGWEDSLEEGMAIHSSMLAWRISTDRSLVGYSPWGCKAVDTTD